MVILKGLHLGFSERAWWQFSVAMRPLAGPASASIFLVWVLPVILQARLLITNSYALNSSRIGGTSAAMKPKLEPILSIFSLLKRSKYADALG